MFGKQTLLDIAVAAPAFSKQVIPEVGIEPVAPQAEREAVTPSASSTFRLVPTVVPPQPSLIPMMSSPSVQTSLPKPLAPMIQHMMSQKPKTPEPLYGYPLDDPRLLEISLPESMRPSKMLEYYVMVSLPEYGPPSELISYQTTRDGEKFATIVTLKTNPFHVCTAVGASEKASKRKACLNILKELHPYVDSYGKLAERYESLVKTNSLAKSRAVPVLPGMSINKLYSTTSYSAPAVSLTPTGPPTSWEALRELRRRQLSDLKAKMEGWHTRHRLAERTRSDRFPEKNVTGNRATKPKMRNDSDDSDWEMNTQMSSVPAPRSRLPEARLPPRELAPMASPRHTAPPHVIATPSRHASPPVPQTYLTPHRISNAEPPAPGTTVFISFIPRDWDLGDVLHVMESYGTVLGHGQMKISRKSGKFIHLWFSSRNEASALARQGVVMTSMGKLTVELAYNDTEFPGHQNVESFPHAAVRDGFRGQPRKHPREREYDYEEGNAYEEVDEFELAVPLRRQPYELQQRVRAPPSAYSPQRPTHVRQQGVRPVPIPADRTRPTILSKRSAQPQYYTEANDQPRDSYQADDDEVLAPRSRAQAKRQAVIEEANEFSGPQDSEEQPSRLTRIRRGAELRTGLAANSMAPRGNHKRLAYSRIVKRAAGPAGSRFVAGQRGTLKPRRARGGAGFRTAPFDNSNANFVTPTPRAQRAVQEQVQQHPQPSFSDDGFQPAADYDEPNESADIRSPSPPPSRPTFKSTSYRPRASVGSDSRNDLLLNEEFIPVSGKKPNTMSFNDFKKNVSTPPKELPAPTTTPTTATKRVPRGDQVDPRGKDDIEEEPNMFIARSNRRPSGKTGEESAAPVRKLGPVPATHLPIHRIGRGAKFPPPSVTMVASDDDHQPNDEEDYESYTE